MTDLYAVIRKTSKYASQRYENGKLRFPQEFPVTIVDDIYPVKGGVGGSYRLEDVYLLAKISEGKYIPLTKPIRKAKP